MIQNMLVLSLASICVALCLWVACMLILITQRVNNSNAVTCESPLGLAAEWSDAYDEAHHKRRLDEIESNSMSFDALKTGASKVATIDRISAYRAKRDRLDGVL